MPPACDERMQAPLTATPLFIAFAPPIAATKGPRGYFAHTTFAHSWAGRLEMRLGLGLMLSSLVDAWRRLFVYSLPALFSTLGGIVGHFMLWRRASKRLPCDIRHIRHFNGECSWGSEAMLGDCSMAASWNERIVTIMLEQVDLHSAQIDEPLRRNLLNGVILGK